MTGPDPPEPAVLEDRLFHVLLVAVSLAFLWILWPFYGAVLWGIIIAIVFAPLYRRLLRSMRQRRTLASLATVAIILLIVILPLTLVTASLVQEGTSLYQRIESGEVNLGRYFQQVAEALPDWVTNLLARFGLADFGALQERLSAILTRSAQFLAAQALNIGQNTLNFVLKLFIMLYLLFFLLRDGAELSRRLKNAIPLRAELQRSLSQRFAVVIRATIKGNLVVAVVQGALGGLILWLLGIQPAVLWAVLMGVLSLLPAVGTALVWVPIAVYLLVTGATWQGVVLTLYGALVIGSVDNILRPILVGKDTKMPDYVVLISTLGGLSIFGFNGFVLGPMIAAMFITVWDIFSASRAEAPPAIL
ncbi:AI-2E family transporter [soil metagenome]